MKILITILTFTLSIGCFADDIKVLKTRRIQQREDIANLIAQEEHEIFKACPIENLKISKSSYFGGRLARASSHEERLKIWAEIFTYIKSTRTNIGK